jgi:aldehyde:ferredoxin oxidoreductase
MPGHIKKPLTEGGAYGKVPEIAQYLPEFYRTQGWNQDGTIPQELLAGLVVDA